MEESDDVDDDEFETDKIFYYFCFASCSSAAKAMPPRAIAKNDNSTFDNVMVAFKDSRSVEIINGRAAMIGWMLALGAELSSQTSIGHQVFSEHSITLADGVVRTSTYAGTGFYMIVPVALVALFASLAPSMRNSSPNGLSEEPKAFGPFSPNAEMINGRASMIGLVALPIAEKFINGSALF